MKTHTIAIVAFVAAALAVAAIMVTSRPPSDSASAPATGSLVLPTLASRINDAAEVRILRAGQASTYRRGPSGWGLLEKDQYPVKAENLRALVIGLAELRITEAKTSRPDLYPRIGVQDPSQPVPPPADTPDEEPATLPSLITVKDASGADLGSVIIGTQKWGSTPEVYIRRAGEAQSWLATGKVDVPWDALAWVERSIVNIPREKWKAVSVTHADGETVTVGRQEASQATFAVEGVPTGRELTSPAAGDSLGSVFTGLTFDDVKKSSALDAAALAAAARAVGTTFEGLVLTARTIELDGKKWTTLEAAAANPAEQPDAAKQADELNARLAGWAFAIPEYKAKALLTRLSDLLKPVEQPPAPTASPSAPDDEAPGTPAPDPAP